MKKNIFVFLFTSFVLINLTNAQEVKLSEGEAFINVNGVDHWVNIKGTNNNTTPLVILHGGPGGDNYYFERTVGALLEKHVTVIYYEQRGCGRSKAPQDTTAYTLPVLIDDLEELRKALHVEKMNLLGSSFGGGLAARYTAAYPSHVDKLILSSPAELSTASILIQIQGFYNIGDKDFRLLIDDILNEDISMTDKIFKVWGNASKDIVSQFLFYSPEAAEQAMKLWKVDLPHEGSRHFKRIIIETTTGDLIEAIESIDTETFIISGIHDKNGGLQYAVIINEVLPKSELKIYRKSAHFPELDETEKYAEDVITFLEKK